MTTQRDETARPAPDLVDRNFAAEAPNRLWVADITLFPEAAGFISLAVVLDAFSRKIVGWTMANHLRTDLVLDALDMAVRRSARAHGLRSRSGWQAEGAAAARRCRLSALMGRTEVFRRGRVSGAS